MYQKVLRALLLTIAILILASGTFEAVQIDTVWLVPLGVSFGLAAVIVIFRRTKWSRPATIAYRGSNTSLSPTEAKVLEARKLFAALPPSVSRPSGITQKREGVTEWSYFSDRLENIGLYTVKVQDIDRTLARIELRSVFRPGVLIASISNPHLAKREGARDYTLTYEGKADDGGEVTWLEDYLY